MSNEDDQLKSLLKFMDDYCSIIAAGFRERWDKWKIEIYKSETYEAIGGLLSRQVTLSMQLAECPQIWNGHIAPLILRAMTDAHITLAWILIDPTERTKKYILYGLGQEKLYIEHLKTEAVEDDIRMKKVIDVRESWLNAQRRDFMTEVNVGNWAGLNTRQMANESDCQGLYKFAYTPFSGVAHNMWQHISRYNLAPCTNPLHKYHRVPELLVTPTDPDYVYRSAKYVNRSFEAFDKKYQLDISTPMPQRWFLENFTKINEKPIEDNLEVVDTGT
ncbi:MAG: hypothetical protein EOM44_14135 [Bacteroidia bacterium]|nr:hypothetical protein [Bacteroidia bacterium]